MPCKFICQSLAFQSAGSYNIYNSNSNISFITNLQRDAIFFLQGLLFGDFTTDEWAKYFRETARGIGIRPPPVEVILKPVLQS